jgi:hypothetical protein
VDALCLSTNYLSHVLLVLESFLTQVYPAGTDNLTQPIKRRFTKVKPADQPQIPPPASGPDPRLDCTSPETAAPEPARTPASPINQPPPKPKDER